MNEKELHDHALKLLHACRTATLATVNREHHPHAANIQYAADEQWRIYFVSSETSEHARDVAAHEQAALTVYDHNDSHPQSLRGLQIRGRCRMLTNEQDRRIALKLYVAKFPFVAEQPFAAAVQSQQFYCFEPSWVRLIDNSRGFGFKHQFTRIPGESRM